MNTLKIAAIIGGIALAGPALADGYPIAYSTVPSWYHAGTKACHFSDPQGNTYGINETNPNAPGAGAQCDAVLQAFLSQRTLFYSLTGDNVPCSTAICPTGMALGVGDAVLGFVP